MNIDDISEHFRYQDELIRNLKTEIKELTLKHISVEAMLYFLIASIAESSPEIGVTIKRNADSGLKTLSEAKDPFPDLEKHLLVASGKDDKKKPHLWLVPPIKP